jgi:hypothetical protein
VVVVVAHAFPRRVRGQVVGWLCLGGGPIDVASR